MSTTPDTDKTEPTADVDVEKKVKNLVARRRGHKAFATKTMNTAEQLIGDRRQEEKSTMIATRQILSDRLATIEALDNLILSDLFDDEAIEKEILDSGDYNSRIQFTIVNLTEVIAEMESVDKASSKYLSRNSSTGSSPSRDNAKLPKLQLKKFSGDVRLFQEFWECYCSAVHDNDRIDKVSKFNYLRSLLDGVAAATISGLPLTAENYEEAVKLLKSRYGNKQVLISAHIDELLHLPVVNSVSDIKKLREVYDCIEVNVRSLKGLDVPIENYGPILVSIVMSKVPTDIRLIVTRNMSFLAKSEEEWKIDDLLKFLEQEIKSREMCGLVSSTQGDTKLKVHRTDFTASSLVAGAADNSKNICVYCRSNHSPSRCDTVTDVKARKAILLKRGRCFVCLKFGHRQRECTLSYKCVKCKGRHNVSICEPTPQRNNEDPPPVRINTVLTSNRISSSFLPTAQGIISDSKMGYGRKVRVLFDNCSQKSYISEEVRDSLKLETCRREAMIIRGFGSTDDEMKYIDVVKVFMRDVSKEFIIEVDLYVVPLICSPLTGQRIELAQATYRHLLSLNLADSSYGAAELKIDVLIGADLYWRFMTEKMMSGESGPVALYTKLGWVISGKMETEIETTAINVIPTHVMEVDVVNEENLKLDKLVSKFWDLESIGIAAERDVNVMQNFEEKVKFDGSRYTVSLPWKDNHDILPDNYLLCKGRLTSLLKRLKNDPELFKKYDDIIHKQEEEGIVENVNNKIYDAGRVHYIPHREVIRPDKDTTKVRIVYDASAKVKNGLSLNECLEAGPSMLPKIFEILVRFRCFLYAITSDIKSAFLNIRVDESDRDFLRFLWVDDIEKEEPKIILKRFTSVIFGVISSPFLLNATIWYHMQKFVNEYPEIVLKFLRDLYMDDCVTGAQTIDDTFNFYNVCRPRMRMGGFEVIKWKTNDAQLQKKINTCEENVFLAESPTNREIEKVFGVIWDVDNDKLIFSIRQVAEEALNYDGELTRRYILKIVSSFYDPLGVLAPIVVRFKMLLQDICRSKCSWDDKIVDEFLKRWMRLLNDAVMLKPIEIPRNYFTGRNLKDVKSAQLHGFSDASKKAYAAVVYLRFTFVDESVRCVFVASKNRIAPVSSMTIPRLELMGCLILSRLIKTIVESIVDIILDGIFCWSDSKDSLAWICTKDKVWKKFIQNRVREIRENVPIAEWKHCPGKLNPADIPTRDSSSTSLLNSENEETWLHAPRFLHSNKEHWPNDNMKDKSVVYTDDKDDDVIMVSTTHNSTDMKYVNLDLIIDKHSFHSFAKLITVICYALRFVNNLKAVIKKKSLQIGDLSVHEKSIVERMWIINEQSLINSKSMLQFSISLGAFTDKDGVVKLKGRLENSVLDIYSKFPVLIPKESYIGELIILDAHQNVLHKGVKDTLNEVRGKFWLVRGRARVCKILGRCLLCRKYGAKVLQSVPAAPLPDFRVQCCDPFTHTGIDYLGPLFVSPNPPCKSSKLEKVHVALYTCANTRAVYLDVVPDESTLILVNSLRRFISRRGKPKFFISDNARCFVGPELKRFLRDRNIEWQFILSKSPWMGGFWERMVQSVKRPLRKILRRTTISYDELLTVLAEIECVINCRPLCYMYSDDINEVLTPSHLMIGRRLMTENRILPNEIYEETEKTLKSRYKYLRTLVDNYERCWKKEYLTELREYQRCNNRLPAKQVKIGDVVLISDDKIPRCRWRLGKVEELLKSKDGRVRGCKLRVHCDKKKIAYLNRPVNKLCYFEVSSSSEV